MPSSVWKYKCDLCETEYDDREMAVKCEHHHVHVDNLKVDTADYAITDRFPGTVCLISRDGDGKEVGIYHLDRQATNVANSEHPDGQ